MKLDFDQNGVLDFTADNIELIDFCISVDSSYRNAFNEKYEGSSAYLITNKWSFDEDTIRDICEKIDKENSTHLAVSGKKENPKKIDDKYNENNQGVKIIVDKIMKITDIENRIKIADTNLVNEIAKAIPEISKFSFASKFCTYISRYKDKNPNAYSIYDKVISEILPYYEWKFLNTTKIHARKNRNKRIVSTVEDAFANKEQFNYDGYNKLIGTIIEAINNKNKNKLKGISIDRTTFDRMLWYYYKGDEQLRQSILNKIPL